MDITPLFEKNLRLYAVSNGYGYTETAVNMLVHGAVDVSHFSKEILKDFDPETLLADLADKATQDSNMTVLKLIL